MEALTRVLLERRGVNTRAVSSLSFILILPESKITGLFSLADAEVWAELTNMLISCLCLHLKPCCWADNTNEVGEEAGRLSFRVCRHLQIWDLHLHTHVETRVTGQRMGFNNDRKVPGGGQKADADRRVALLHIGQGAQGT